MKGKRHTTEDRIRILREADGGKNIVEICREKNISEVTFHRWRKQSGQMDLNEAKHVQELQRENPDLKKRLAEALLARVHSLGSWLGVDREGTPGPAGAGADQNDLH